MCTPGPGRLFIGQYSFKRKKPPQSSENGPVLGLDQKLNKKQPMSNEKHTKRPSEGQENYCSRILFKKNEDSLEAKYKALQGGTRLLHSTSEATGELLQTHSGQQRVIPLVVK